jgi:riboflavin kinase/FMN adenylyltransferase
MAVFTLDLDEQPPTECRAGVLSIGNFDGVHLGHVALISALQKKARELKCPAVAITFDPPPLLLLRPEIFQPVLTAIPYRAELLHQQGAELVLILRTTPRLLNLTARQFFEEVIQGRLQARSLVEGENFCFGHNREGTVDTLLELARPAGMVTPTIVPSFLLGGIAVSSSRVRSALLRGDVQEAANLLGRPYQIEGRVGTGQRRGKGLGFPTANLEKVPTLIPGDGVYAVRAVRGGGVWGGAANIGPNPTFGEQARKVEVHLLDFQGDLYGQRLTIKFIHRLRDTKPFAGVEQLIAQLQTDVEQARQLTTMGGDMTR